MPAHQPLEAIRWCARSLTLLTLLTLSLHAAADVPRRLPRDYFLDVPPGGHYAHLDAFTVGAQASYEYRAHIEEDMSMLHARASGLVSYPYAEASANLDVRVFLLTLGASYGYQWIYRNIAFAPNESDRSAARRNEREDAGEYDDQDFTFYEGRARLTIPLDSFFLLATGTLRNEYREDNSFDWLHGNVHDGGLLGKIETTLFFRHPRFGAVGPYLRYMDLPRTDPGSGLTRRESEVAYGIMIGARVGLVKPTRGNSDLFLLMTAFRFGDDDFGLHAYRDVIDVPMVFLVAYRVTLGLGRSRP
jgi:hypothetical protein